VERHQSPHRRPRPVGRPVSRCRLSSKQLQAALRVPSDAGRIPTSRRSRPEVPRRARAAGHPLSSVTSRGRRPFDALAARRCGGEHCAHQPARASRASAVSRLTARRYFLRGYVLSRAAERGLGVTSRPPARSSGRWKRLLRSSAVERVSRSVSRVRPSVVMAPGQAASCNRAPGDGSSAAPPAQRLVQCFVMCDACSAKVISVAHDSRATRRVGTAQISRSLRQRSMLGRNVRRRFRHRTHERRMPSPTGARRAASHRAGSDRSGDPCRRSTAYAYAQIVGRLFVRGFGVRVPDGAQHLTWPSTACGGGPASTATRSRVPDVFSAPRSCLMELVRVIATEAPARPGGSGRGPSVRRVTAAQGRSGELP